MKKALQITYLRALRILAKRAVVNAPSKGLLRSSLQPLCEALRHESLARVTGLSRRPRRWDLEAVGRPLWARPIRPQEAVPARRRFAPARVDRVAPESRPRGRSTRRPRSSRARSRATPRPEKAVPATRSARCPDRLR